MLMQYGADFERDALDGTKRVQARNFARAGKFEPVPLCVLSKPQAQFDPSPARSARRKEGGVLDGEVSGGVRRKRPGDERALGGESGGRELRRGVITAVEQVVNLNGQLE